MGNKVISYTTSEIHTFIMEQEDHSVFTTIRNLISIRGLAALKELKSELGTIPYDARYVHAALKVGYTPTLMWISENNWKFSVDQLMIQYAILTREPSNLDWLRCNITDTIKCNNNLLLLTIKCGNANVLKWFIDNTDFQYDRLIYDRIVVSGNEEMLSAIREFDGRV